ncbi:MAG TPA: hypothetical protein ENN61_02975 [Bacteroidaceae bacterium]|nr:hypothetical protein [Bacteroidaceae bacterium]
MIKHPDEKFEGFILGVQFFSGIGSTNSFTDVQNAAKLCKGKVTQMSADPAEAKEEPDAKEQASEEKAPEKKTAKAKSKRK